MEMVQLNNNPPPEWWRAHNSPTESPRSNNELAEWAQNLEGDDDGYALGYHAGWMAANRVAVEEGKAALAVRLEEERLAVEMAAVARGVKTEYDKGYIEGLVLAAEHIEASLDAEAARAAARVAAGARATGAGARAVAVAGRLGAAGTGAVGWVRRGLEGKPKQVEVSIGGRATKKITRQRDKRSRRKRQRKRRKTQTKRRKTQRKLKL